MHHGPFSIRGTASDCRSNGIPAIVSYWPEVAAVHANSLALPGLKLNSTENSNRIISVTLLLFISVINMVNLGWMESKQRWTSVFSFEFIIDGFALTSFFSAPLASRLCFEGLKFKLPSLMEKECVYRALSWLGDE